MGRFKHSSLAAAAVIGLGGFAAPAFADLITVHNVQVPYYELTTISGNVDGMSVSDSNVITGQIVLTVDDNGGPHFTLPTWCVDLFHTINLGGSNYQYTEGPLSTDNSGPNASTLTTTQITEIGDLVSYGDALMQSSPSNANSAIVQAAIWTVEYNNGNYNGNGTYTGGTNYLTVTGNDVTSTAIGNAIAAAEAHGGSGGQLIGLNGVQGQAYETAPAPSIGSGLPVVLAVGGVLFGASLPRRSNRRRSLGAANPYQAG